MRTYRDPTRAATADQISITIPVDMLARIDEQAKKEHRNRSNFITVLLEQALSENDKAAAKKK